MSAPDSVTDALSAAMAKGLDLVSGTGRTTATNAAAAAAGASGVWPARYCRPRQIEVVLTHG